MALINYKPTTPGRRHMSHIKVSGLSSERPPRALVEPIKKTGGRNSYGRITSYHRGGGAKRQYRIIDFLRVRDNHQAKVLRLERDPNRSAFIALIVYEDGHKSYILAPANLKVGDVVRSGPEAQIQPGCALALRDIPVGTTLHNVALVPRRNGILARSAGAMVNLVAHGEKYAQIKLPSGEIRLVPSECRASIGQLSNLDHENVLIGKAGRMRHMGWRPNVRGVAMNPTDHPLGGGEGKTSGGRHPCSPWGQSAKGKKTRHQKRTQRFILSKRKR